MKEKKFKYVVFTACILLILINSYFFTKNFYWISLFPIVIFGLFLAFINLKFVYWFMVFSTPLAVGLADFTGSSFDLSLPSEPIMIFLLFLVIVSSILKYNEFYNFEGFNINKHLIFRAIISYLTWILLTSITSTMPLVSFKFFLSKLWLILPVLILGIHIFKETKNIEKFIWIQLIPMLFVIFYTLQQHSVHHFSMLSANKASWPFYNDHTIYAAILAMFIPILITFSFQKEYKVLFKNTSRVFLTLFIIAIIFSYTRGAWLSLVAGLGVYMLLMLKIKLKTFIWGIIFLVLIAMYGMPNIFSSAGKTKQQSSDNMENHLKSVSNVSSDASNVERLNRWSCAFEMFKQKPIFGYGPGTYQFQYAPFQLAKNRTIISTNLGKGGNAHSEYLGPLAETGIIGTLTILIIIFSISITAIRLYYKLEDGIEKSIVLALYIGLVTYWVHGFINNFLDTDKASIPYWGFVAVIIAIDIKHRFTLKKNND